MCLNGLRLGRISLDIIIIDDKINGLTVHQQKSRQKTKKFFCLFFLNLKRTMVIFVHISNFKIKTSWGKMFKVTFLIKVL